MSVELEARYHVPRSQVWEGSQGRQRGHVHLHVQSQLVLGGKFAVRQAGRALCLASGWYERPAEGEELCPRCKTIADRFGLIPSGK
jgi:hypothetical protein